MKFLEGVIKIFYENAKSSPEDWLYGDYIRWIKEKKHWSLDINIGA